jgi:hypothetical protein
MQLLRCADCNTMHCCSGRIIWRQAAQLLSPAHPHKNMQDSNPNNSATLLKHTAAQGEQGRRLNGIHPHPRAPIDRHPAFSTRSSGHVTPPNTESESTAARFICMIHVPHTCDASSSCCQPQSVLPRAEPQFGTLLITSSSLLLSTADGSSKNPPADQLPSRGALPALAALLLLLLLVLAVSLMGVSWDWKQAPASAAAAAAAAARCSRCCLLYSSLACSERNTQTGGATSAHTCRPPVGQHRFHVPAKPPAAVFAHGQSTTCACSPFAQTIGCRIAHPGTLRVP